MICVKFKCAGKIHREYFATHGQAKRFCIYELANEGYELFFINKYNKGAR